jgi:UDP-3-O-[3-hydroxymyristoyl] glucosamine N-acyltransferase
LSSVSFSLPEVLQWTGGRLANESALGRAPAEIKVNGVSGLAGSRPEHLAFFFSKAYQNEIPAMRAGILITGEPFVLPLEKSGLSLWKSTAVIACKDPYLAMALVSAKFAEKLSTVAHIRVDRETPPQIHPSATVHPSAKLAKGVRIGANVVIEESVEIGEGSVLYPGCYVGPGSRIGEACVFFPNVVLYEWTQIGNRVRLHAGAVVGADGFGYAPRFDNGRIVAHQKIYHLGRVIIGDDVEVGAAATIDRGTVSDTRIDRGAKLDNNVQVGHNAHVGEGAVICGNAALAGSSSLGKFVYVAGLAGIGNQVHVGDGSRVAAGTLVGKDVPPGKEVIGYPHRDPRDFYKIHALLNQMLKQRRAKSTREV